MEHVNYFLYSLSNIRNHIATAMVNVLASGAVDRGFEPRSGQTIWYMLLLRQGHSIKYKEKEQKVVGSESE